MQLTIPVHMVHGDKDDFAPIEVAERLARETPTRRPIRFVRTQGANHFLNDGPAQELISILESCLPPKHNWTFRLPKLPSFGIPKGRLTGYPSRTPAAAAAQAQA